MFRKLSIVFFLFSLLAGTSVFSQDADETIAVSGAWVRATVTLSDLSSEETPEADMVMGGVSAAYMTIQNHLPEAVRLYGAESSAASTIEIHETRMQGDVMQMRPIEGVDIPAGETAVLAPRGLHIMMFDLQQNLVEGEAIQMTLNFEILNSSGEVSGETFSQIVGLPILSEPPSPLPLDIQHVWARPASNDGVSAVYMTIYNPGETPERLIGVETAVAELAEIHETRMQGDVMEMRPVEGGVDIPAGETAVLAPRGLHIMLLELHQPLLEGEALMLTLLFESGEEIAIAVPIYDLMMMGM